MDLVLEIELELELELELLRKLHLGRLLLKGYALSLKSKHITGHCQEDSLALVEMEGLFLHSELFFLLF